jgi:hypothetical protein
MGAVFVVVFLESSSDQTPMWGVVPAPYPRRVSAPLSHQRELKVAFTHKDTSPELSRPQKQIQMIDKWLCGHV